MWKRIIGSDFDDVFGIHEAMVTFIDGGAGNDFLVGFTT